MPTKSSPVQFPQELIVTSNGKKVAPTTVEDAVKEALPIVKDAVLIGEGHKYLTMLLSLKVRIQRESER